jgi:hypothetical protein
MSGEEGCVCAQHTHKYKHTHTHTHTTGNRESPATTTTTPTTTNATTTAATNPGMTHASHVLIDTNILSQVSDSPPILPLLPSSAHPPPTHTPSSLPQHIVHSLLDFLPRDAV